MKKAIALTLFTFVIYSCKKEIIQYSLNTQITPINGGTVTPNNGSFEAGQKVSLLATPNEEFQFKNWGIEPTSSENPLSLVMDSNKNITVNFEKRPYPLSIKIEGQGQVKEEVLNKANNSFYPSGTNVKLTAIPSQYWRFTGWTGDVTGTDSTITLEVRGAKNITATFKELPLIPAINTEILPNINWNDHVTGKNTIYDFNMDGTPDIVSYEPTVYKNTKPAIVKIFDYKGKTLLNFNIENYKKNIRDSLGNVLIDYGDLNKDGFLDLGLSYMSEWWTGTPGAPGSYANFIGNNIFLLLSKGSFNYDVVEILDAPNDPVQFNINLFDWDSDGLDDVLYSAYWRGNYLKNLGNNKFEKRTLSPKFNQGITNKVDFDKDGKIDYVNLFLKQIDENGNYTPGNEKSQVLSVLGAKGLKTFDVIGKKLDKYIYIKPGIQTHERISLVDGDLDGDTDLIVGSLKVSSSNIWTYNQDYFENSNGQFIYKKDYIELDESLIGEFQVWVKDLDGDGDEDLFYPTYRKSQLNAKQGGAYFWWENTGKGFKINKKFRLE